MVNKLDTFFMVSERLQYNKITEEDRAYHLTCYTNRDVMKYITGQALTQEEAKLKFDKILNLNKEDVSLGYFAVKEKTDGTFIGFAKLVPTQKWQAEIGYVLLPQFWGNKYASEIVDHFVKYATQLPQLKELIALIDPQNIASEKVLTGRNFEFDKTLVTNEKTTAYYKLNL